MANKNNIISDGELSAESLQNLGLSKQPFANEILTSENFFEHQALTKITESLMHQVQFSDLILLIEGDHGAGKTALFRQFIQQEISNTKTLSMQAEATDTLADIQQKMSIHLQDLGDKNQLTENLNSLKTFDQIALLCMDNSHVLSDTTLQELLRYRQQLKTEHEVSLKILFFANTGFSETLRNISDLQAEHMYVQNIPGLSPKQAETFIMHRLRCAGFSNETQLSSDELEAVMGNSVSTPLDIMIQAAKLINKKILDANKPKSNVLKITLIAAIIIGVIATGAYFAVKLMYEEKVKKAKAIEEQVQARMEKIDDSAKKILHQNAEKQTEQTDIDVINALENDTIVTNEAPTIPVDAKTTETHSVDDTISEIHHDATIEPPVPETTIKTKKAEPEPLQTEATEVSIQAEPTLEKTAALHPALQQLNKMGLHDASWLKQQDSGNWSLQFLGAREPKTLLAFSKHHSLSTNTAWYKTWLKEKPYYVLVHGSFTSRDAARNAIKELSPKLQALKPWVKSMKSIQKALPE